MSEIIKPTSDQNPPNTVPGRTRKPRSMVTDETIELNRRTNVLIQREGSKEHWVVGKSPQWPSESED